MSKVKLIIVEGYGTSYSPSLGGTDKIIDTGIEVPDTHSILTVVRSDFDKEPNGDQRVSEDLAPVLATSHINNLVGQLLTLTDATFSDKEQRKAMKDLITQTVWGWEQGLLDGPRHTWRRDKGYEK